MATESQVLGVHDALALAQSLLDDEIGSLSVRGEVFEYRGPYRGSGHYYFKLRDADAVMEVKMWARTAARGLRCELEEGRQVLVKGRFDIWPKRGNLSFILEEVRDQGVGDLARRFEQLKQRLFAEGLFDPDRKLALPERPRTVALLTAHPSAAAADVLQTLQEYPVPIRVWLRPCRVQGEGAVGDLLSALTEAEEACPDLIFLTRGGGSLEDLWAFNEEALVRAVAASKIPILCAVGHETDYTLCDFAASYRAKTPTAGAVFLTESWLRTRAQVADLWVRLEDATKASLAASGQELGALRRDLHGQRPDLRLERKRRDLYETEVRLEAVMQRVLRIRQQRARSLGQRLSAADRTGSLRLVAAQLEALHDRLEQTWTVRILHLRHRLQRLEQGLRAASPRNLLERGYALVEAPGRPGFLRSPQEVKEGDRLKIRLARGGLDARVEKSPETDI